MSIGVKAVGEVEFVKGERDFWFVILLVWLVISSVYYVEQLLTGDIFASFDDYMLTKLFKYVVVFVFSFVFMVGSGCFFAPLLLSMLLGSAFVW